LWGAVLSELPGSSLFLGSFNSHAC
jgi:hypothetical protein